MKTLNRRELITALLGATSSLGPARSGTAQTRIRADAARIDAHLEALAAFGRSPEGGVSRLAYSDADLEARRVVMGWMREAALDVSVDPAANLVGRRPGREPTLRPLVIGSHVDSVPNGGNYDGQVGSLAAIEVARSLREARISLRHPLEVLIFQNEEGGTIGSHALTSGLTAADLDHVAQCGKTVREGIRFLGGDPDTLPAASPAARY